MSSLKSGGRKDGELKMEEANPAAEVFGAMTVLDKCSLIPTAAVLVLMSVMISARGTSYDANQQMQQRLKTDRPWRLDINETKPAHLKDISSFDDYYAWADHALFPKLAEYEENPHQPKKAYAESAKILFAKNNGQGAVRLKGADAVRLGPIAMRQARRVSATDEATDEDAFDFYLSTHVVGATPTPEIEPISDTGYFNNYETSGFYAPDPCLLAGQKTEPCTCDRTLNAECRMAINEVANPPAFYTAYLNTRFPPGTLCRTDQVEANYTDECPLWINNSVTAAVVTTFIVIDPYDENRHSQLFTCTVLAENPVGGSVIVQIACNNLGDIPFSYDTIVIVLLVVYFTFEMCNMIQQGGDYFSSLWKYFDIVQIALLVVYLVLRFAIRSLLDSVITDADIISVESVLKANAVITVSDSMIVIFGIASLLNLLKVLRYLGIFPLLALPCLTVVNAGWPLVSFGIMTAIVMAAFAQAMPLVMSPYSYGYMGFGESMSSLVQVLVAGPIHGVWVPNIPPTSQWYATMVILTFRFLLFFIMMPIAIAIVAYAYNDSKVGFKKQLIDTERLYAIIQTVQSRPFASWFSSEAIQEAQQLDREYLDQRAQAIEMHKSRSIENQVHIFATEMQALNKSLEHMSVRFATFATISKQLEVLTADCSQTRTVVMCCMQETSDHLGRLIIESKEKGAIQRNRQVNVPSI